MPMEEKEYHMKRFNTENKYKVLFFLSVAGKFSFE
jgi:hypothetical protein